MDDMPHIRITPLGEISMDDITAEPDTVLDRFIQQCAAVRVSNLEQCYWRMIAAGQLPSMGWRIGERTDFDGRRWRHICNPLPPPKNTPARGLG